MPPEESIFNAPSSTVVKPLITYNHPTNRFHHNGEPTAVIIKHDIIRIGCLSITPEAAKIIMLSYEKNFGENTKEVVL